MSTIRCCRPLPYRPTTLLLLAAHENDTKKPANTISALVLQRNIMIKLIPTVIRRYDPQKDRQPLISSIDEPYQ
ncbi:hypothetical protein KIN20_020363 [Parelaphostrongylus tenuis]|uniref:Uncharacterized protein n=1 Tax=Parelaphostrongylus tenuis TaxID=148309 RepID=A0AAD5MMC1_PARTN|nr:hypothetical protein KIN20_020363 [Parelaphostrongylus tenuis]